MASLSFLQLVNHGCMAAAIATVLLTNTALTVCDSDKTETGEQ